MAAVVSLPTQPHLIYTTSPRRIQVPTAFRPNVVAQPPSRSTLNANVLRRTTPMHTPSLQPIIEAAPSHEILAESSPLSRSSNSESSQTTTPLPDSAHGAKAPTIPARDKYLDNLTRYLSKECAHLFVERHRPSRRGYPGLPRITEGEIYPPAPPPVLHPMVRTKARRSRPRPKVDENTPVGAINSVPFPTGRPLPKARTARAVSHSIPRDALSKLLHQ